LFVFIFLAGFSIILCQVIWIREFTTVFGIHVISGITLLATFMVSAAIGSYFFGRLADKKINLLMLFAVMEAGIGIFSFAHPCLFRKVVAVYLYLGDTFDLGPYSVEFIRILSSFAYFLIPASLMGGILPVLSKLAIENMTLLGKRIGMIYGCYNLGIAMGCFLSGFIFIGSFGMRNSLLTLAMATILVSLLSLVYTRMAGQKEIRHRKRNLTRTPVSDEFVTIAVGKWKKRLLLIFTFSSFIALTYKIIWTRLLIESSADKTIYFITLISACLITGIAFGSFVFSRIVHRVRRNFLGLAILQILIGITALLSLGLFGGISSSFSLHSEGSYSWSRLMVKEAGLLFAVLTVPYVLLGIMFPLVVRMYAEDLKTLGRKIGTIGLLDASGAVAGIFITTFILVPLLGTFTVFISAAFMNVIMGVFIIVRYRRINNILRLSLSLASVGIFIGLAFVLYENKIHSAITQVTGVETIETRREGSTATVNVQKRPDGNIALYINGEEAVSSDPMGLKGDKLLSYLPFLFKPDAKRVFIIGLGIGITAKSMADMNIPDIEIVEISPEVTKVAANAYAYINDNILANENISITIEDGRSYLLRSKKKYDIIICNAAHPRLNNALYTTEFYRLCRQKLMPDGFVCQWLPINWLAENEFRSLIKACTDVFPDVTLWYAAPGQTLLLASSIPQLLDYCKSRALFDKINQQGTLSASGIKDADQLIANLLADNTSLREYARKAPANTDLFPRVEFSRVLSRLPDTAILMQLSNFRIDYNDLLVADTCSIRTEDVINSLTVRNLELRKIIK
jgi:spermidine synthase